MNRNDKSCCVAAVQIAQHLSPHLSGQSMMVCGCGHACLTAYFSLVAFFLVSPCVCSYGLLALQEGEYVKINPQAQVYENAPIACIGAGTGLGE